MPTHQEVLEALRSSVAKWQGVAAGSEDWGGHDCALCAMFKSDDIFGACGGCPVATHTGANYCFDSPYRAWADHQRNEHCRKTDEPFIAEPGCTECRKLALAELDFLKDRLDEHIAKMVGV